jgi:uncharacterized protein YegL
MCNIYIYIAFSFQAIEMLSNVRRSVPIIFLVTDGTVEDERQTCDMIKNKITGESIFPRLYTFGIGIISHTHTHTLNQHSNIVSHYYQVEILSFLQF